MNKTICASARYFQKISISTFVLSALLPFLSVGCGGSDGEQTCNGGGSGNTLSGSYCEDTELVFTEVMLLILQSPGSGSDKTLRIEYVNGQRSNKTLQLIVPSTAVVLEPNREINLREAGASVRRFTAETSEAITLTNELESSSKLEFSEYQATVGTNAAGQFNLLFKSGRTLNGEFQGTLVDALEATTGD